MHRNLHCFAFAWESFWNFKFSFLCRHKKSLISWVRTSLNFKKGGQLIQRVLPKTQFFGLENRGRLIHRVSLYTGIYGIYNKIKEAITKQSTSVQGLAKADLGEGHIPYRRTPPPPLRWWVLEIFYKKNIQKLYLDHRCHPVCFSGSYFSSAFCTFAFLLPNLLFSGFLYPSLLVPAFFSLQCYYPSSLASDCYKWKLFLS